LFSAEDQSAACPSFHSLKFMKNKTSVSVLLFIATFVVGCKQEQTTSQQLDKLKSETKEVKKHQGLYVCAKS